MKLKTPLEPGLTRIWGDFNHSEFCIITAWAEKGDPCHPRRENINDGNLEEAKANCLPGAAYASARAFETTFPQPGEDIKEDQIISTFKIK